MSCIRIILLIFFMLTQVSCSKLLSSKISVSFGTQKCDIAINQDSSALQSTLLSKCDRLLGPEVRNANYQWTLSAGSNTCSWITISNDYDISGIPNDNQVGQCQLIIDAKNKTTGVVKNLTAIVNVINVAPTLTIQDTTVTEDSALVNIRADLDVQSNEEGFGVYSLNNSATLSPKCSDHGIVLINPLTGEVDFDPDLNFQTFCNIAVSFNDQNSVNNIVTSNFLVTINVTNDAADIVGTCGTAATQDVLYTCNGLSYTDVDVGDPHTWSFTAGNTCSWMSIDPTTGVITGTPNDNQVGTCLLGVQVFDGLVYSTPYTATITTANVAPYFNPVIANPANLLEDSTATIIRTNAQVNTNEEGYGIYILDNATATVPKCSSNGTLAINSANGQVTFTPAANYDGACYVKVTFNDQNPVNNLVSSEFLLTMTPVNDIPVITSTCPAAVNELAAYTCTSTFTDTEGSPVSWAKTASDTCTWATVNPTTGAVTGTPARADVGTCTLAYTANDGTALSAPYSRTVTVNNVAPVVTAVSVSLAEDSGNTVVNTAAQVTSTDEGYGTYSIIAASSNDCQAKGTVSIDSGTGALSYAPTVNFDTSCKIKIQFNDGKATNNLGNTEITITMIPSPDPAVVSIPAGCTLTQNEDVAYSCTPVITDPDTGDTHTWSINSNTCAWIPSVTAATGVMAGTPNDDHVGSCGFSIKATGNQDGLVTSNLTAAITITNVQPTITGTNPVLILMNAAAANIVDLSSSDETHGVYSLIPASGGGIACENQKAQAITINAATGVVNYKPLAKFAGLCKINVQFDDQNSTNNTQTFEFTVNVQDFIPPEIEYIDSSTPDATYILGDTITIQVKFDEEISINTTLGTPRLFLETGAIDRYADYVGLGGVNNDTLTFTYTVQSGDITSDLNVHSTVSTLDLRDAVIKDRFNNTQLYYATPIFPSANSLKARRDIVVNGSVSLATVTGLPSRVSPDLILNATVSGPSVVNYRYKLTDYNSPTSACSNATGYSANIPVATLLTDSLVPFTSGTTLRICVVGVNGTGVVTPYASAFEYVWTKDLFSVSKVSFASVTNLSNWQDSEVDPDNNNIIYAKNLLGEIYKSTDYGVNFEHYCSVAPGYESQLEVSPGPDRTPYAFQNGRAYKITDLDGGNCTDIFANIGVAPLSYTTYLVKNYEFTSNGDIYAGINSGANFKIYRSFNQGTTWSLFSTTPNLGVSFVSFIINPTNPQNIIYELYQYGFPIVPGIYTSTDAGVTKTYVTGAIIGDNIDFKWDIFNPSYVYTGIQGNSHKSANNGATWTADSPGVNFTENLLHQYNAGARWDIDKVTGYAYRLRVVGNDSILQKGTNLAAPGVTTWINIKTFPSPGYYDVGLNVSVSGNAVTPASPTLVVNIRNQMFVSTDGGANFTEIFAPKELKLASITSFGDGAIYGATKDWAVVKTTDNGKNWIFKQFDYTQCLGVPPRISVNREDNQKVLMWSENRSGNTDCSNFNYSIDGMASQISRDSFSIVAPRLQVSMSINDSKNFYISGRNTNNFLVNTTENNAFENLSVDLVGLEFTNPVSDSYISPLDKNKMWVVDNVSTGIFYEYDLLSRTRTNLTSSTGLTTIAAMDSYVSDNGEYRVRFMDRIGKMRSSDVNFSSFANEGNASGLLTSCNSRFLYHHPRDKTLILTACLGTNIVAYSKNGGNSWTELNTLTQFNINCNVTGAALSSSKIFLACSNADTFEVNYTSVENINEINDNILTVAEQALGQDLINHLFPATYNVIKYALIMDGDTCNASTPGLSTVVPKSNDPFFTTRGGYRVCIEQKDLSGGYTYTTSTVIFYDITSPVFTSIDLVNDAADGKISYIESFNQNNLVGNLVSNYHDFVKYAVVTSATTCDGSLSYDYQIPKSQNTDLKTAGTYKVCVQLTTKGNLPAVYGSSSNFTFDPTTVLANITNAPTDFISADNALDVIVTGTNVTDYKYKVIAFANSCKVISGYSGPTPIATHITTDLSGYATGTHLKLCVLGLDATGNLQALEKATEHYWIYSKGIIAAKMDFSGANTLSAWRDVAVHQSNPQLIYAINDIGEIFKSENAGTNWNLMCRTPNYSNQMHLKLSPGDDGTAYVHRAYFDGNGVKRTFLYRVDSIEGQLCPNLWGDLRGTSWGTYNFSSVDISPTGIIYDAETQYNAVVIRKSLDFGKSWQFVGQIQDSGVDGGLFINPTNPNYMLLTTIGNNSPVVKKGLSKSTDGGKTWTFIQSAFFNVEVRIFFDPAVAGRVYTNNGYYSMDNGSTWQYDAALNTTIARRWWVDGTGNGYQTIQSSGSTYIKKSTGLNVFNFVNVKSFPVTGQDYHSTVSAAGTTIATIVDKQLHISTNSGSTFMQVFWPGKHLRISGLDSANGVNQFAVANGWHVFSSLNEGSSWNYKTKYYNTSCNDDSNQNPMRMMANPVYPDAGYVFAINCMRTTIASVDNFNTSVITPVAIEDYIFYGLTPLLTDPNKFESLRVWPYNSLHESYFTDNLNATSNVVAFDKNERISDTSVNSFGSGYLGSDNKTLYVSTGRLIETRRDEKVTSDLTGKLSYTNPAAIKITTDQAELAYKHIVISSTGVLNQSKDNGQTYSQFGNASGTLTNCSDRLLVFYPHDTNIIATACPSTSVVAYTHDKGLTWREYNLLGTYGLNCTITGMTVTNAKISIACQTIYDALTFYHNPVVLENQASDNLIFAGENDGQDLISIYKSSIYSAIQYAIISEGAVCSGATTGFSTTIPKGSDLTTSGNYQVCVKLTNGATTYEKSSVIHYAATAPVFTSINVVSPLGVHQKDLVLSSFNLVNSLVGSNYEKSFYALVKSTVTCNDSITYSEAVPKSDSILFTDADTYKVCVALANYAGQKVYGSSANFEFSHEAVVAKISNFPEGISSTTALNITVSGTNVDGYKFKVGDTPSTNCKVSTGYSASTPVGTPITTDITGLSNTSLTLCVLGVNANGKDQIANNPTIHKWTKNVFDLATQKLGVSTHVDEWQDIVISKGAAPIMYASTLRGRVFKSTDRGVNWEFQCQVPYDATSRIVASNNSTNPLAFITSGGEIYRVDYAPMPGLCPSVTSTIGTIVTNFSRVPLVISFINEVYLIEEVSTVLSNLYYSNDRGETWTLKQALSNLGDSMNLFIDPNHDKNIILTAANGGNVITVTQNGGLNLESLTLFTTPLGPITPISFLQVANIELKFDPSSPETIYTNNNYYTNDNGGTWFDSLGFNSGSIRWDMANDGVSFKLTQNGANVKVEKATTGAGVTTLFKTINNLIMDGKEAISVSGDGNTVAVIIKNKAFISESGANFAQVYSPDTTHKLASITSENGSTLYGVDYNWNYYKSTNGGSTYAFMNNYSTACTNTPRVKTNKSNSSYVYSWAFNATNSLGCTQNLYSLDGLVTPNAINTSLAAPAPVVAFNQANSARLSFTGSTSFNVSLNAAGTFTNTTLPNETLSSPNPDGVMSTVNPNITWYLPSSNKLVEADAGLVSKTDITAALNFATPAGIEGFADGSFAVMSRTGQIDVTANEGISFTSATANPGLQSCQRRLMRTLSTNANFVASACFRGTHVSYTKNAGTSWTEINLASYPLSSSCIINDIAIFIKAGNKKISIACEGLEALTFDIN